MHNFNITDVHMGKKIIPTAAPYQEIFQEAPMHENDDIDWVKPRTQMHVDDGSSNLQKK